MELAIAANHWQTAIDVHQAHFPNATHDTADISQVDPRRYPRTDILLASPECTNHSQARGVSRKKQDLTLFDAPDPAAERSRATMWDVPRFAEQMRYDAIVVENVVEATKWVGWRGWSQTMDDLGYECRILSHNSMFHGVPQSRDRIYVVFWRKGMKAPDLELELQAHCPRCETERTVRQSWKRDRFVGRYRQQWMWRCIVCGTTCEPSTRPAADIIDWTLDCPRIGDRLRPLADKTRARILAGLQRYGWAPIVTAGAGNTYETTPGNRAKPVTDPLPTQTTTAQSALVVPLRANGNAYPADTNPLGTITAGGHHHALLMRNNTGGAEMVTPVSEPARTITTAGHQSLLMPYYGQSKPQPTDRPMPTVTTVDRCAVIDVEALIDDCGLRMLQPYEAADGMGFPVDYIPRDLPKSVQMKLAGNAVTPPAPEWILGRVAQALEAA